MAFCVSVHGISNLPIVYFYSFICFFQGPLHVAMAVLGLTL